MTAYELSSLILQIIGTIATIFACIGIYYAKRSLELARIDYQRKLHIETRTYARDRFKDLRDFSLLLKKVDKEKLSHELIESDIQLRSEVDNFLNLLEDVSYDLREGLYDNKLILAYIRVFIRIAKDRFSTYIDYKRRKSENYHLWEGVSSLFSLIDKEI